MSKIAAAFDHGKAFIAFITCGDPDLETTGRAVRAAVENGADLIELGIPFSDPTAEGPVIQEANLRALTGGVTTDKIFGFVRDLRKDVAVPLVFMTYANVIFSYGAEKFISACAEIGIDGLILSAGCCDVYSPKVLRGSMGGVFRLPLWETADMAAAINRLQAAGACGYACVPSSDGDVLSVVEAPLAAGSVCVIGNEANGLDTATIEACTYRLTIPMAGRAESLNAAVAASLVMWEMSRREYVG